MSITWEEIEAYVERTHTTVAPNASYGVRTMIDRVHMRTSKFRKAVESHPEQEGLLNTLLGQVFNKIDTDTQTTSKMVNDMAELDALYNHVATVMASM